MNTKLLSLDEVSKLVDELSPEGLLENSQVLEFIDRVEKAGKEILKSKERPGEYMEDAAEFILSATVAEFMGSDSPKEISIALVMLKNPSAFKMILGTAFIYAVGLCATEELR
jgi:hypothetical protein